MARKRKIETIYITLPKPRMGATKWGGYGKTAHDSRPKRRRTRFARRQQAITDASY